MRELRRCCLLVSTDGLIIHAHQLASMFLHGTSTPHISWSLIGIGLRYAQDLGAHRRKAYNSERPIVEEELLKRAFWYVNLLTC